MVLRIFSILWFVGCSVIVVGQENTIGLLYHDMDIVSEGYVLINPENQSTIFLIDECGQVAHKWETDEVRVPGKEQYLDKDGNLILASAQVLDQSSFGTGGAGGVIEIIDWDGNVNFRKELADSLIRQHHDIHLMPNGNILAILWQNVSLEVAASLGFDTLSNPQIGFWPDKIVEIDPELDSIIWEWNTLDHMVQDIDSSLSNYGVISDFPELININYLDFAFGRQDVHHINSIDYNQELDQILLSVRNFNEVWIIDHSTTTAEAASHHGGNSGKGGDLLYRWGNPAAYNSGLSSDQKLFRQHDASWIVDEDHTYFGGILFYNNFIGPELSLGNIFIPSINVTDGNYELDNSNIYLPLDFAATISHPDVIKNFSTAASNIQLLPNGNFMMCAGRQGRIFEVTDNNELAWEYLVPMRNGFPIAQGQELSLSENFTFSARKYSKSFEGFIGKDLTPSGYIELEPNLSFCDLTNSNTVLEDFDQLIYPNPVAKILNLRNPVKSFEIIDIYGKSVLSSSQSSKSISTIDVTSLQSGLYILNTGKFRSIKFLKI